jgi:hypothetical protein
MTTKGANRFLQAADKGGARILVFGEITWNDVRSFRRVYGLVGKEQVW